MVVNCPECSTKFRVSTEKIPAKGAKLRCAKCSHIFFVKPEEEAPAAPALEVAETPQVPAPEESPAPAQEAAGSVEEDSFGFEETPAASDFGFEESPADSDFAAEESPAEMDDPFGDSDFDLSGSSPESPAASDDFASDEPPAPAVDESPDSAAFDFEEDAPAATDEQSTPDGTKDDFGFEEEEPAEALGMGTQDEFDPAAFDAESSAADDNFSFDEDYGNVEIGSDNDQSFSFDDEEEDDKDNFGTEQPAPEQEISTEQAAASFEEEDPLAQESFEEQQPAPEPYTPQESDDYDEQELPSGIQVSKKRSPFATLILFLLVLILAIVVAGGVLYWQSGPEAIQQLYQKITGQETGVPVKGQILVKNLQGSFVSNKTTGELLVIQGKAINNFRESRAAIQVKGILFDNQGKQLRQKTIFCGNPISSDDLRALPFDKLEEIMGNQFGESLVNLNVTPGQVISFTIVFRDIPENLSEFVVEVAGSNPAAQ